MKKSFLAVISRFVADSPVFCAQKILLNLLVPLAWVSKSRTSPVWFSYLHHQDRIFRFIPDDLKVEYTSSINPLDNVISRVKPFFQRQHNLQACTINHLSLRLETSGFQPMPDQDCEVLVINESIGRGAYVAGRIPVRVSNLGQPGQCNHTKVGKGYFTIAIYIGPAAFNRPGPYNRYR